MRCWPIGAGGWRAIFLINVPLGALAAVAVRAVPAALAPGRTPGARFDLPGLVLLAAGLTGLLLGASQGAASGWTSAATLVPLIAGAALLAGYAVWAPRRDQPALDLSLARRKVPALSMAAPWPPWPSPPSATRPSPATSDLPRRPPRPARASQGTRTPSGPRQRLGLVPHRPR